MRGKIEVATILRVLRSEEENKQARRELELRGLSMVRTDFWGRIGRRLRIDRLSIGDLRKSWDVLNTAKFIEERLGKDQAIVDFGAFHSEITCILHRMGYTKLYAVDLNQKLAKGPYSDKIHYTIGDFLKTGFAAEAFAAITAISAIEHGNSIDELLSEVSRLLKPGGYFIGSTDYWPEKLDTRGIKIFGMDWTIFSASELETVFDTARKRGLDLVGPADYHAHVPVINFSRRQYTFAWFVLQKQGTGSG